MRVSCRYFNLPLAITVLSLALAGCQQQDAMGPPEKSETLAKSVEVAPLMAELPVDSASLPATPLEEEIEEQKVEDRPPLDLTIPQDILNESADTGFAQNDQPARLPNLFGPDNRKKTSVSGKFIFEDEERASLEDVNGAEIIVKVPLK